MSFIPFNFPLVILLQVKSICFTATCHKRQKPSRILFMANPLAHAFTILWDSAVYRRTVI